MRISDWSSDVCSSDLMAAEEPEGFGEAITDQRQGMAERFGPAAQWLGMSDGFARTGKTELAAKTLEKGLEKYPDNVDLWVGLGNALAARSEEHTSELQSLMRRSYAVFCLKKKKIKMPVISCSITTLVHIYLQVLTNELI